MSLQLAYADSFSHYTSPFLGTKRWTNGPAGLGGIGVGVGRNGSNGVVSGGTFGNGGMLRVLPSIVAPNPDLIFVTAMCAVNYTTAAGGTGVISFGSPTFGSYASMATLGDSSVYCTALGTSSTISTKVLQPSVTYQVQLSMQLSYSPGSNITTAVVNCYVDTGTIIVATATGSATGAPGSLTFCFGDSGGGVGFGNPIFSDLAIFYDDAGAFNPFSEINMRVPLLMPSADGHYTQWTPLSGPTSYNMVNEIPPDNDTTYISTTAAGNKSSFTYPSLSSGGKVVGLQVVVDCEDTTVLPNTDQVSGIWIDSSSVEHDGTAQGVQGAYTFLEYPFSNGPAPDLSSGTITPANVNGSQFGVYRTV